MTFEIDDNLRLVAAAAKAELQEPIEEFAHNLCEELFQWGVIKSIPSEFDKTVMQATAKVSVANVCAALAGYLYGDKEKPVQATVFDAFCKLILRSEGCPKCGGRIKYEDCDGHIWTGDGYEEPRALIIDTFIYSCCECGHRIISDTKL